MEQKPQVSERLVKYLKKTLPPREFRQGEDESTFVTESIFRAGQRDVITRLEMIQQQQKRGR